jgi:uncharacterized protein involved in type VI secretion and phage assembly
MPGYDGTYRGVVLNTADPTAANRIQVQVPDVSGADGAWATPEEPSAPLPGVGDEVTIRFENGDEDRPLWSPGVPTGGHDQPGTHAGYHATYRGTVVDNTDPGGYQRVAVQVPDVSTETMWAMPEHADAPLPAVGDEVFIRFEDGDVSRPLWSGGSGTGATPSLEGNHRGTVTSNMDPAGLGRLYVQVPGLTDGVWAEPEQPPPSVGEEVSVTFEGGSADHARWSR